MDSKIHLYIYAYRTNYIDAYYLLAANIKLIIINAPYKMKKTHFIYKYTLILNSLLDIKFSFPVFLVHLCKIKTEEFLLG